MITKNKKKNLQTEVDTCYLYQRLTEVETDESIANVYRKMSEIEMAHAIAFSNKFYPDNKGTLPTPSGRAKTLNLIGKIFGYDYVLGMLMDTEKGISSAIIATKNSNNIPLNGAEANHVKILRSLLEEENKVTGQKIAKFESKHR